MARLMNQFFAQSQLDKIGVAYNKLIKSITSINNWTDGNIYRATSVFKPPDGIVPPYILNQCLTGESIFMPSTRQRITVICGSLLVYEEPFEILADADVTVSTVADIIEQKILSDPHLKVDDNIPKTERVHKFELESFEGIPVDEEDKITMYVAYRTQYIVDINYLTRAKM